MTPRQPYRTGEKIKEFDILINGKHVATIKAKSEEEAEEYIEVIEA